MLVSWPGFEPAHSGVVLRCTNHKTTRAILNFSVQIVVYKRYFDNSAAELFF